MDAQTTTIITGALSSAGGALTVGWLSKLLITRFLKDNDKKHDQTGIALLKISDKLSDISKELGHINGSLAQVTILKEQIQNDHDTVIELKAWNSKYHDDLKAQFGKIRIIEESVADVGQLISGLVRSASND